jgi:type II secretory pathway pseudopilin PulG
MLRRTCTSSSSRPGFTTIESLIAAVVFLVGLAGLLSALVQARGATAQARRLMQATDVANDLSEQIQLWAVANKNDARLESVTEDPCLTDPMDKADVLLKPASDAERQNFIKCMHGELDLTKGGVAFGGLKAPVFKDSDGSETRFERYYIVNRQPVRDGVQRIQVWVKVLYSEAGAPRVVNTQTLITDMGGV